jgi:anaerobic magnesium-protoporphyrin IX monomethyl ester cyclase
MTKVTLVYPFFQPAKDNSIFRFPPLGLGYVAAALKKSGFQVDLVDCTFLTKKEALEKARGSKPNILGFYSMFSIKKTSMELARSLRNDCDLLVVGGPLPTLDPTDYLDLFDVAVIGEGEETMVELSEKASNNEPYAAVKGIAYKRDGEVKFSEPRGFVENLDELPFPSRELFDNDAYKGYYRRRSSYSISPMITSRGCPFSCDFCSRPVFGQSFRTRSATNIVDEVETIVNLSYDRVWFADDCFTLNRTSLMEACNELVKRRLNVGWECLSRVDTMDREIAQQMKRAGCVRVFFGIESGSNSILRIMRKQITVEQARRAVYDAKAAGLQVGAFFIIGYPGENDNSVLDTVRFASGLPLDYISFTLPYPIPGTALFERVKDNGGLIVDDWEEPKNWSLIRHKLLYGSSFSEMKLKFAIGKAHLQHYGRRYLGEKAYSQIGEPLEHVTDAVFRRMP